MSDSTKVFIGIVLFIGLLFGAAFSSDYLETRFAPELPQVPVVELPEEVGSGDQVADPSSGLVAADINTCAEFSAIMTNVTGTCGNFVLSAGPTFTGTAGFANTTNSGTLTVTGVSTLGLASTTGLSVSGDLWLPASADPTVTASSIGADCALNTTTASTSVRCYDGSAERVFNNIMSKSAILASSTLAYMGGYGASGTTSLQLWNPPRPITVTAVTCRTDTGTGKMNLNDGTNLATMVNCSTTGARTAMAANNTWVMSENFKLDIGTIASAPNTFTVTIEYREDAD